MSVVMLSVLSVLYVSIVVLWLSSKDTYTHGLTWWYATVRLKSYRLDTSLYLSKHSEVPLQNYKDNSIAGSVTFADLFELFFLVQKFSVSACVLSMNIYVSCDIKT